MNSSLFDSHPSTSDSRGSSARDHSYTPAGGSGGVTFRQSTDPNGLADANLTDRTSVLDLDVLDLDAVLQNDDDYWLTGNAAGDRPAQTDEDIFDWLKRAAEGLEPRKRHSLALKLEAISRKNAASCAQGVRVIPAQMDGDNQATSVGGIGSGISSRKSSGGDTELFYDALSDLNHDLYLAAPGVTSKSSDDAKKSRRHTAVLNDQPPVNDEISTPDFVAVEEKIVASMRDVNLNDSMARKHVTINTASLMPNTASLMPNTAPLMPNTSRLSQVSPRLMHAELHTNLEDIELLASMQQEDLRQYVERIRTNRRSAATTAASGNVVALLSPNRAAPPPSANMPPNANMRYVHGNSLLTNPGRQRSDDSLQRAQRTVHRPPSTPRMATNVVPKVVNIVRRNVPPPSESSNGARPPVDPSPKMNTSRLPTPARIGTSTAPRRSTGIPTPNRHRSPAVSTARGRPAPPLPPKPAAGGGKFDQQQDSRWKDDCF